MEEVINGILIRESFKTNNSAVFYYHTDRDNFLPII